MQFFCTMPTFVYADYHRHHQMLAGRGLPTVPEEDFFPEVEDTAGLPPSSSPPSVSTPTPTTHLEFTSRQTAVHPYDEPQSPQLYSHQDTFIPSQSHHSSPNTGAASPILTTLQLRQEGSSEKHGFARRTGTTTSPQIRLESPDERIPERKISPPSLHSSSSSSESFAVPKNGMNEIPSIEKILSPETPKYSRRTERHEAKSGSKPHPFLTKAD
ncbi:hypothetical protein Avbf_13049 [Armadillidium vulgare]|nr:hypothetical protein Avbf_13049 [Armadillidium vulgare]